MYTAFYIELLFSADRDTQKKLLAPKDADIVKLAAESVSFSMVRYQEKSYHLVSEKWVNLIIVQIIVTNP